MREILGRAALALILIAPIALPFPYGANRPEGAMRLQVGAFLILALAAIGTRQALRLRSAWVPVAVALLLVALGLLQVAPLSTETIESLSPRSAQVWTDAATVLELYQRSAPRPRISIVPWETIQQILLIAAWLALFLAALTLRQSRQKAVRWIVIGIAFAGVIHALHGTILIRFPESGDLFGGRAHGTFINPNHFATYLNVCLAAAYALLLTEVLYAMTGHRPRPVSQATIVVGFFITATAVLIIGTAILLSQSRGGIASSAVMIAFMTVAALFHPRVRTKRRSLIAGLLLAAIVAGGGSVFLGDRSTLHRFLSVDPRDPSSDARTSYWGVAIEAWEQYPVLGSGLGTFREAFRHVQPFSERGSYITHAHNDPIELLVTGGVAGFAIGILGFFSILVLLLRAWWREKHREPSVWILAGVGALLAVSLHSLVEFPYTIPAIPAVLSILLGACWRAGEHPSDLRGPRP